MKVPNIIRIAAVVIGLGAALTLTSSVQAQEIENTVWADGPNVAPFAQQAASAAVNKTHAATTASPASNPASSAVATQEPTLLQQPAGVSLFVPIALVCMALVALPAILNAKRATSIRVKTLRGEASQA